MNHQEIGDRHSQVSPLISVITVVFNAKESLEPTIQSVINQSYENTEYIIIDGGSTDGTLEIIKQYEPDLKYWISESDRGIYDAMNKGIKLAKGKIIGILNSGDLYSQNALQEVAELYLRNQTSEYLIITGAMTRFAAQAKIEFIQKRNQTDLNRRINLGMPLNHPATFVTKNIYETIGYFDPEFKICGDYDLIFRAYHSQLVKFVFINSVLASMSMGGISETLAGISIRAREAMRIRQNKLNTVHNALISLRLVLIGYVKHLLMTFMGPKAVLIRHKINAKSRRKSSVGDRENLSY
ncbi:MAG TPA: glycosyltransferase family 2 protein [Coleofasciculaceae cyanobacterium]|jgi:glycosyltransferase involved in cell wall biosynthesis